MVDARAGSRWAQRLRVGGYWGLYFDFGENAGIIASHGNVDNALDRKTLIQLPRPHYSDMLNTPCPYNTSYTSMINTTILITCS